MMIKHIWTVICANVVTDKESNNVSLQNILEQLTIQEIGLPQGIEIGNIESLKFLLPQKLSVVSLWTRKDITQKASGNGRVRLISPKQEEIMTSPEFNIDLENNRRFRSTGRFEGLPVQGSGIYKFIIELSNKNDKKWEIVSEVPLELSIIDDVIIHRINVTNNSIQLNT